MSKMHGSVISKLAVTTAEALSAIPMLTTTLAEGVRHFEENRKSSFRVYIVLLGKYGKEHMDGMPRPGTKPEDVSDNEPYDRYSWKDAADTTHRGSFYTDLARLLPDGAKEQAIIDGVNKSRSKKDPVANEYSQMSDSRVTELRKQARDRLGYITSLTRDAMSLHFNMALANGLPNVVVRYAKEQATDKEGNKLLNSEGEHIYVAANTTMPIIVEDDRPDFKENLRKFSVKEFLRLSVKKAKDKMKAENIDAWNAFVASSAKEAKTPEGTAVKVTSFTVETSNKFFDELTKFFDEPTKKAQFLKYLNSEKGGDALVSFGNFQMSVDSLWTSVVGKYNDLSEKTVGNRDAVKQQLAAN